MGNGGYMHCLMSVDNFSLMININYQDVKVQTRSVVPFGPGNNTHRLKQ